MEMDHVAGKFSAAAVATVALLWWRSQSRQPAVVCACGTRNPCKVTAVREVLSSFPALCNNTLHPFDVSSGIGDQPLTMEETAQGARNRAEAAFGSVKGATCKVAFGIESGLLQLADGSWYDVCVTSAFDGFKHHLGMSCAFEIPPAVVKFVLEDGMDLAQAVNASGLSSDPNIGKGQGLIGILSRGRMTRLQYTKQSLAMALMFSENEVFGRS